MKRNICIGITLCWILTGCGNAQVVSTTAAQGEISTDIATEQGTTVEETATEEETTEEVERTNCDFRNAKWGDDKETVKKYEKEPLAYEEENVLGYETSVSGNNTYCLYWFDKNGKLYQSGYSLIMPEGVGEGQYISTYNALKDDLTEIYGDPWEDEIIPLVDQKQIDYSGEASSLRYGYVTYRTQWKTSTTDIMLGMQSQDYKVQTLISYTDINYEEDLSDSGL